MSKQKGIWILTNEIKKKVWIGTSTDLDAAIRYKLSAIKSADGKEELMPKAVFSYPEALKNDILNKEFPLVHCRVYKIVLNDSMLRDFSMSYTTDLKRIMKTLNLYSRYVLFKDYELYNGNTDFYMMNPFETQDIKTIELYDKENLVSYKQMEEYDYLVGPTKWIDMDLLVPAKREVKPEIEEEKRIESVQKTVAPLELKEMYTVEQKEIDVNKVMKLLEIESVLVNEPIEDLLERFISDKAKQIYKIASK